jgi:hypothetical protein
LVVVDAVVVAVFVASINPLSPLLIVRLDKPGDNFNLLYNHPTPLGALASIKAIKQRDEEVKRRGGPNRTEGGGVSRHIDPVLTSSRRFTPNLTF